MPFLVVHVYVGSLISNFAELDAYIKNNKAGGIVAITTIVCGLVVALVVFYCVWRRAWRNTLFNLERERAAITHSSDRQTLIQSFLVVEKRVMVGVVAMTVWLTILTLLYFGCV